MYSKLSNSASILPSTTTTTTASSSTISSSSAAAARKYQHRIQHILLKLKQHFIKRYKLITFIILIIFIIFNSIIETHIQISFYNRKQLTQLLPPHPPNLSRKCFTEEFISNPFKSNQNSFPSSPAYNLTLGSLSLHPKVLTLSPGFNLPHHEDCYRFANTIPLKPTPNMILSVTPTYYHLYWRSDLAPISDRQIITLKSLLATQDFSKSKSPNKNGYHQLNSQIILWTNPSTRSLENDQLLAPLLYRFKDRLSLKIIDLNSLSKSTPLENHHLLNTIFDKKAWLDGDLIRILLLWHYGGFWIDMDNLILRDLKVLTEHEWVVQWDCYDKPYEPLNGHIIHFQKQSPYLCEMMSIMSRPPWPRKASTDWGQHLYYKTYRNLISAGITPFKVLPYCFTDGRSCSLKDRVPDPFEIDHFSSSNSKSKQDDWDAQVLVKLNGLFSIHLHNQWHKQFPKNGWVYRLYINHWNQIID
ncbi:hypothetical protein MJO28_007781 [Puccinia striiformis f. sp. tritici]|uniref:Uncharacterized protein n=1 Tax=Puccinia striiformis f. sp. tritici TaxID=168172 RepID=A0ACC0EEY6_9BASI|nr:hypothetical protein MJO28_007781 [Puccinia striiformis f. sp. tritici]